MEIEPNTNKTDGDPVESLRHELEAMRAERRKDTERLHAMEGQLEQARRSGRDGGVQWPTTAEGWNYALQVAALRAEANPDLSPALSHMHQAYNQWLQEANTRVAKTHRDVGRVEAALSQLGIEAGTREHRFAISALQAGASFDDVEEAYLKTLQTVRVKEAGDRAKDKQVDAASRAAIEGGRARVGPPADETEGLGPTPDDQFMSNLRDMLKSRAPSSVKIRAVGAAAS